MKVVFDTSGSSFIPGGISRYINLIVDNSVSFFDYGVHIVESALPRTLKSTKKLFFVHQTKVVAWEIYYMNLVLPLRTTYYKADLLHCPAMRVPVKLNIPAIVTIYDIIPLIFPRLFRARDAILLNFHIRQSIKRADLVLTISNSSKQDIMKYFKIASDKIKVVYLPKDPLFYPRDKKQIDKVLDSYGIKEQYFLCVGNIEPRKNLLRVLKAFSSIGSRNSCQLVIVGQHLTDYRRILLEVSRMNLDDRVKLIGFVTDEELAALYSGSVALVYPSLYEGFGLPLLEAMACGCPVISSNNSSIPEVVGSAGILVDPYNVDDIRGAMENVISDKSLVDSLRQTGVIQASKFTLENFVKQMVKVYRSLI